MIDPGLQDKVVLVSGANNPLGIGAATAKAFAREGAQVFITYQRLKPDLYGLSEAEVLQATGMGLPLYHAQRMKNADEVVAAIRAAGGRVEAFECDLTDTAAIPLLFDRVAAALGPVDVLVNNAAHYEDPDTVFDLSAERIDRTYAVNTRATLLMIAEFVRRRKALGARAGGRVINLSTDAAQRFASQITYGGSKAQIEAFTRSIAIEVGHLGITVNTVAPGPIQTGYIPADFEAKLNRDIPLGRLGQPEDIANAILFLASAQAEWLTGNVLKVSGGHEL